MTMKLDVNTRVDLARSVWNLFINNINKLKIHYGKNHVYIVIQLKEDIDSEDVTEASMTDRYSGYSELRNVSMPNDGRA